jgi:hypothetical protein
MNRRSLARLASCGGSSRAVLTKNAEHRALVLSGHGTGSELLRDEHPPTSLTVEKLRKELAEGLAGQRRRPLDVLALDTCLMSTVDTALAVSDYTNFLVASEGLLRTPGWPHAHLLAGIFSGSTSHDATSLVEELLTAYKKYYADHRPAGISVDLAATQLEEGGIKRVKESLEGLTGAVMRLDDPRLWDLVVLAHWRAQSFNLKQYTDVRDFCSELRLAICRHTPGGCGASHPWKAVVEACCRVEENVDDVVADGRHIYVGPKYQHAKGLSIYFPWSPSAWSKQVKDLPFGKPEPGAEGGWAVFLTDAKGYLTRTMREMEGEDPERIGERQAAIHRKVSPHDRGLESAYVRLFGDELPCMVDNPALQTLDEVKSDVATHMVKAPEGRVLVHQ